MGKLKKFLKLRKQSDTVKLIMLIMILGIAMLIGVFYEGVKIYIDLQNEVEYIIVPQSNPVTKRQIDELRQIDNVKCVTPQKKKI